MACSVDGRIRQAVRRLALLAACSFIISGEVAASSRDPDLVDTRTEPQQTVPFSPESRSSFWDRPRRGANCANTSVEPDYWKAAAEAGIEYVRLIPDSWRSAKRDFLFGDTDDFRSVNVGDLATLVEVLDDAEEHGVKVLLGFFSQPGSRWRQLNDGVDEDKLWSDQRYHAQSASFWRAIATALRRHPAIVGYNLLNEPHPEKRHGHHRPSSKKARQWFTKIRGTPADVNEYNRTVIAAIREVDRDTPVFVDGPFYASPGGIRYVEPIDDPAVIYAVHFYGEWTYSTYRVNKGRFSYPDRMPTGKGDEHAPWTRQTLRDQFAVVDEWRKRHGIPRKRIAVTEFGVDRRVSGAEAFLRDTIRALEELRYHWAFYAFRSDGSWGGMDYELGTGKLGWQFWKAIERGEDPELHKRRGPNPLWSVIQDGLRPKSAELP